jgi:hypothetical protein
MDTQSPLPDKPLTDEPEGATEAPPKPVKRVRPGTKDPRIKPGKDKRIRTPK